MSAGEVKNYKEKIDEINRLLAAYPWEPAHSVQVKTLALKIFDLTKDLHCLGSRERFLLEAAAMLHDIGFTISAAKHHKHSQKLISEHLFKTMDKDEIDLIALIARYHRKAHPVLKHPAFRRLENPERDIVVKLSAILRIADGLDRTHTSSVKEIKIAEKKNEITFLISPPGVPEEDIYGAYKKKKLFEEVFRKKAVIKTAAGPVSPPRFLEKY